MADKPLKKTRITAAERRERILDVASFVFAQHGFDGTTTQMIAKRGGVSEPILYRHFASKAALYRAVLRRLMRYQDRRFGAVEPHQGSTVDHVRSIKNYFERFIEANEDSEIVMGQRLMLASLAQDGAFAKLMYRRAIRRGNPTSIEKALKYADAEGLAEKIKIDPTNAFLFLGYIGAMLSVTARGNNPLMPYEGTSDAIVRDALIFCTRGIGISDLVVAQLYDETDAGINV